MYNKRLIFTEPLKNKKKTQNTRDSYNTSLLTSNLQTFLNGATDWFLNSIADQVNFMSGPLSAQNLLIESEENPYDPGRVFANDYSWHNNMTIVGARLSSEDNDEWDAMNEFFNKWYSPNGEYYHKDFTISSGLEEVDGSELENTSTYLFSILGSEMEVKYHQTIVGYGLCSVIIIPYYTSVDGTDKIRRAFLMLCTEEDEDDPYTFFMISKGITATQDSRNKYVKTSVLLANMLTNVTTMDILKETCLSLSSEIGASSSNLLSYVSAKTGNISSKANGIITEMTELLNTVQDRTTIAEYIKNKMNSLGSAISTSAEFHYTDNDSLIGKSVMTGLVEGLITTATTFVALIGTAIGGVWGVAIVGISAAVSVISKLVTSSYDKTVYCSVVRDTTGKLNDFSPFGAFKFYDLEFFKDYRSVMGASMADMWNFTYFGINNSAQELHLRLNVASRGALHDVCTYDSSNSRMVIDLTKYQYFLEKYRFVIQNTPDINILSYSLTGADLDLELRWRYICSLAYLLIGTFIASGPRNGSNYCYLDINDSNQDMSSIAFFLKSFINEDLRKQTINNFNLTWNCLLGVEYGSGAIGNALYHIGDFMHTYSWFQTTWVDNTSTSFLNNLKSYITLLSDSSRTSGEYPIFLQPIYSVQPPNYTPTSFWISIATIIAVTAIITTVAAVATFKIKRKMNLTMMKRRATAEANWQNLMNNRTDENAAKYYKSAKINNFYARLCNGTILNKTCYWADSDDSSNGSIANMQYILSKFSKVSQDISEVDTSTENIISSLSTIGGNVSDVKTSIPDILDYLSDVDDIVTEMKEKVNQIKALIKP